MDQLDRIENKIEALDNKLDSHLERIAKMEVKTNGFITLGTIVTVAIVGTLARLLIL